MRVIMVGLMLMPLLALASGDDELRAKLRDAEQRMQDAAREMAELNMQLHGEEIDQVVRLIHRTAPRQAMLGINIGTIRIEGDGAPRQRPDRGVEINGVTPGGPAEQAGLQAGDILIAFNGSSLVGEPMRSDRRLTELMQAVEPGETVRLDYLRGEQRLTAEVVTRAFVGIGDGPARFDTELLVGDTLDRLLDELPPLLAGWPGPHGWHGLELVPLNADLGRYFGTDEGILVVRAPRDNQLQLQGGDVIRTIGGATPKSPPDAMRLLRFYQPGDKLVLEIVRQQSRLTLDIMMPGQSG